MGKHGARDHGGRDVSRGLIAVNASDEPFGEAAVTDGAWTFFRTVSSPDLPGAPCGFPAAPVFSFAARRGAWG